MILRTSLYITLREKDIRNINEQLQEMGNWPQGSKMHLEVSEEENGGNGREAMCEAVIAENLPELKKDVSL